MNVINKKGLAILILTGALVLFFTPTASAALPVAPGPGESCNPTGTRCDPSAFRCQKFNGKNICAECTKDADCTNATCKQGVCVERGGNRIGDYCADKSHCPLGEVDCIKGVCAVLTDEQKDKGKETGGGGSGDLPGVDLTITDVFNLVTNLACWLLRIITAVIVIFLIWAGLRFMWAGGNPTKVKEAATNLKQVLIGLLVIFATYVIIATVANAVGVTDFSFIPLVCR